ncbi:unnamed protein product [Gadus morhua 'NCC']
MWSRGSASRRVWFGVLIKSPLTVVPAGAAPRLGPGFVVYEKQNAAAGAEFLCLTALDDRPRVTMATAAVRGERGGRELHGGPGVASYPGLPPVPGWGTSGSLALLNSTRRRLVGVAARSCADPDPSPRHPLAAVRLVGTATSES